MSVKRLATLILAVVMLGALIPATALAKPGGGGGNTEPVRNCPSTLDGFLAADNVDADYTGTTTVDYFFSSLEDQNPVNGVPGLVGYCVYTDGVLSDATALPDTWKADFNAGNVAFVRGGGNKTNIPLDGTTNIPIGTAEFGANGPTSQTILLHIADSATCRALYGGDATTCYVLPKPGPVCNAAAAGDSNAAYNDIPKDAVDCGPPSEAFEAQSASEFGDEVTLDASGDLQSLTVLFNSYACEDHPLWNNSECYTSNNAAAFTHTITANIYGPSVLGVPGTLLATATETFTNIPYRPSADTTNCGTTGAFFNPISENCEFSKKVLLTFTNWDKTPLLSGNVVWTVAYNTTHYGYNPIGEGAACYGTTAGCPYDSLNVGTRTFPNAPYAGSFVDANGAFLNSTYYPTDANGGYCDGGTVLGTLRADTAVSGCWNGLQPLGTIVLGP